MSNVNMEGLPPEMQARISQIIEGAKQKAVANSQPRPETPHQAAIPHITKPVSYTHLTLPTICSV